MRRSVLRAFCCYVAACLLLGADVSAPGTAVQIAPQLVPNLAPNSAPGAASKAETRSAAETAPQAAADPTPADTPKSVPNPAAGSSPESAAAAFPVQELLRNYLIDEPGATPLAIEEFTAKPPVFPAPLGERLVYAVNYLGVPIGHFAIEVVRFLTWQGRRVVHVVGLAKTTDVSSQLYPIYDRSEAWIDIDEMQTLLMRSHTKHGRKEKMSDVRFDWDTHYLHLLYEERHKGKIRELSFDFGPYVHEAIELLYQLRRVEIDPGFYGRFPIYASRKIYEFQLQGLETETLASPVFGDVIAVVVEPAIALDGKRMGDARDRFWVRASDPALLLRIKGWPGEAQGFLTSGVEVELIAYVPQRAGWMTPPLRHWQPKLWDFASIRGMPQWEPPDDLRAARKQAGAKYRNVKRYVEPRP